ncbi:bifunctional DNA primase/polymerase [Bradyrhizobium sp. USDA 4529]
MPKHTSTPAPEPAATIRAALHHARRGRSVFPVRRDTRVPRLSEKKTGRTWGASSDPAAVEQMFRRYPSDDLGIVTGASSGLWVLDVDNKNGKNGSATLEALQREHCGDLRWTAIASTPSGGEHHYFAYPGRHVYTTTSKLGAGLDVRGDGGYVVAPPSRGRRWVTSIGALAPAPAWLVALVCEERQPIRRSRIAPQAVATPPPELLEMWLRDAGRGLSSDLDDVRAPDDVDLKVWCALRVIPADIGHNDWFRIGCSIYAALGDAGFEHFDEWSREAPHKYPRNGCADKWRECAKITAIGEDTVYWFADQHDRTWRDAYRLMLARETAS